MTSPKVSVCIITYNHEKYIRECLDGVLMQKVDFPMEVLIHDDASTDGTVDILQEYHSRHPELIRLILQEENQHQKGYDFISRYLYTEVTGKYLAICEGDDFWTDEYKLQKQVNILEKNEDLSICAHSCSYQFDGVKKGGGYNVPYQDDFQFSFKDEFQSHFIATASVLIRAKINHVKIENSSPLGLPLAMGDIVRFLHALSFGNGFYINQVMSVKRKNPSSISRNKEYNRHIRIQSFFAWSVVEQFAPIEHRKAVKQRVAMAARTILLKQRNYPKPILLRILWRGMRADFKTLIGLP